MSEEVMKRYPSLFDTDFEHNKHALEEVAEVRSKMLRNKVAGYVTKMKEREAAEAAEAAAAKAPEAVAVAQ